MSTHRFPDRHQLFLRFADGGAWIGGHFSTKEAALAAVPAKKAEWLSQVDAPQARRIESGSWIVVKRPGDAP